jgi:hypothetical protein
LLYYRLFNPKVENKTLSHALAWDDNNEMTKTTLFSAWEDKKINQYITHDDGKCTWTHPFEKPRHTRMQVLTPLKDGKGAPVPDSKAKAVGKFARNYDMDASVVSDFVKPAGSEGKYVVVWTELIAHALKTREKVTQTQAGLLYAKLDACQSTKQKDKFWGPNWVFPSKLKVKASDRDSLVPLLKTFKAWTFMDDTTIPENVRTTTAFPGSAKFVPFLLQTANPSQWAKVAIQAYANNIHLVKNWSSEKDGKSGPYLKKLVFKVKCPFIVGEASRKFPSEKRRHCVCSARSSKSLRATSGSQRKKRAMYHRGVCHQEAIGRRLRLHPQLHERPHPPSQRRV